MKTTSNVQTTGSRKVAKGRPKEEAPNEFISLAATKSLVASSAAFRQQRLAADDMLTTEQAAELVNASRVTINAWIKKGRAIGLTQTKRGFRMPSWQFDLPMWDMLPKVSNALGTNEGWALLAFLESPNGGLDGITPRQAIERGQSERVVELAAWGN